MLGDALTGQAGRDRLVPLARLYCDLGGANGWHVRGREVAQLSHQWGRRGLGRVLAEDGETCSKHRDAGKPECQPKQLS